MDHELTDEFFQVTYSLPKTSNVIISDNELFKELGLDEYIQIYNKEKLYIDVELEQVNSLVNIYFKKIFDPDEHMMLYDHKTVYSSIECMKYIKLYQNYLYNYEYNLSLFVNDKFYQDIYLNCKRITDHHLLIRPKKFIVFKAFINHYYEYVINQLKLTIKYLNYNINLYKEPSTNVHFTNVELFQVLMNINEVLATKTTFRLFREYGIPIKIKDKHNLVSNMLLNVYISKNIKEMIFDVKVLLIEFYKYEYIYHTMTPDVHVQDILSNDMFVFDLN
jgi:hypothetical protein